MINEFIELTIQYAVERHKMINNLKQLAIDEYKAALLMPRKKKKIAKKSALMLYSIACHGEEILNF